MNRIIYTIDSRENVMFEVIKQYFNISELQMFEEISNMHNLLMEQLKSKGVSYFDLKSALVPSKKKREIILVFDTQQIENNWYGAECFNAVIKLLDKSGLHSFLCGDYISRINVSQKKSSHFLYQLLSAHIDLSKIEYQSSEQLFFIYMNNVSNKLIDRLKAGLQDFCGFAGMADVSLSSPFKVYVSSILTNSFIQYHDIILQPSSDVDGFTENVKDNNIYGYEFESNGFNVRCIYKDLYDLFLTYKIERLYFNIVDSSDQAMAVNAIAPVFRHLRTAAIIVPPEKLEYLLREKGGTMQRIGFSTITPDSIAQKIKENIDSNYIFGMEFRVTDEYQLTKFNIMIEINSYKITLGLKYNYTSNILTLITMF